VVPIAIGVRGMDVVLGGIHVARVAAFKPVKMLNDVPAQCTG